MIPGIKQKLNEIILNNNKELKANWCRLNEKGINKTFVNQICQYKYSKIITIRQITPEQIVDIRRLSWANINNDHSLLIGKIKQHIKTSNKNLKIH